MVTRDGVLNHKVHLKTEARNVRITAALRSEEADILVRVIGRKPSRSESAVSVLNTRIEMREATFISCLVNGTT